MMQLPERRLASDGVAYTLVEFEQHYGVSRGRREWDQAPSPRSRSPPSRSFEFERAAIVPAAAPLPVALATQIAVTRPAQLRIGPSKHGYVYARTELTHCGEPIYMCCRGREVGSHGRLHRVFLGSHWEAGEVPMGAAFRAALSLDGGRLPGDPIWASDIVDSMEAAFRAAPDQDILADGWHSWQCYAPREGTWWPSSEFQTTVLM